jgi:hypothetical protein
MPRTAGQNIGTLGCVGLAVLVFWPAMVRADGGTLRFSKRCGDYRITLFTAPPTLSVGPVDFSVLVQSIESETPLLDLPVTVHVYPEGKPQQRLGGTATSEAATNKLFWAIPLDLPEPGRWQVEVAVDSPQGIVRAEGDLEIGPAVGSWSELTSWIIWPAGVVLLFVVHQFLGQMSRQLVDQRLRW